jgi:hypothetical protein
MTSSLISTTKNNQVSYIDVENTKDSLSEESYGEIEVKSKDVRCENCGKIALQLVGVGLCGIVFGIAMEKSRGKYTSCGIISILEGQYS